jgi:hypothetical protein
MTEGYYPPEHIKPAIYAEGRVPCGPWTNVWQIGRVTEAMMKLAAVFDNFPYRTAKRIEKVEPDIISWCGPLPGQDYSYELRKVVFSCMRYAHISDRPQEGLLVSSKQTPLSTSTCVVCTLSATTHDSRDKNENKPQKQLQSPRPEQQHQ